MSEPPVDVPPLASELPADSDAKPDLRKNATAAPRKGLLMPLALLCVATLAAVLWIAYDTRHQLDQVRTEVARQLRDSANEAHDARAIAGEAQEALREAAAKTGALEAKVLESQNHQVALEALYQELSRNRDDWVLAEIEQTLAIASQQLQLAGNVKAALVALQSADARLARSDQPQFLSLRKAITGDIEKLRRAPNLDVTGMTLRIDRILSGIDELPLLVDGRAQAGNTLAATAPYAGQPWWSRWALGAWNEIKQLVRVERLDAVDPQLLAPEQRYFARENLKMRLLHARIALLQRDQTAFRSDLRAAQDWLHHYFDAHDKAVSADLAALAELNGAALNVDLPDISDSLSALRSYKLAHEHAAR
jgi:uroporphyrin-3 C-methyltransferase